MSDEAEFFDVVVARLTLVAGAHVRPNCREAAVHDLLDTAFCLDSVLSDTQSPT
jgi:hypothetical protein